MQHFLWVRLTHSIKCARQRSLSFRAFDQELSQALLYRVLGHRRLLDRWVLPAIPTASFRRARTLFPSLRLDMLWPRRRPLVPGSGPPATMPWPPIGVAVVVVAPAVLGAAAAPPLHSRAAILLPLLLSCATTPADMPNARIGHLARLTRPHQRKPWLRHEATGTGEAEQERRVAQPRPNSPPRQRQENQIVASGSQFCSCTWTVVNVLQCPAKRLVRSAHLEARDVLAPARQRSSGSAQRTRVPNARKVLAKCGGTLRSC